MDILNSLIIAFATYSRIPMPKADWSQANKRYTMCFFPLVGLAAGAAVVLWLWLCDTLRLGPVLQGAVGAVIPLWVTGGIHMDGLMDTMDALASWQSREKRLEIMKDSHTGAFAVIGCAGYLLVLAGLLSEMEAAWGPMILLCFIASRALSAWAMATLPSARPQGMLDSFARASHRRRVERWAALGLVVCGRLWARGGGWTALLCMGAAAGCALYYRRMALKHFGGVTGDLAGWYLQTTEMCLLVMVLIGGKL
ncbi:MAG: adenosylcobinamide-GDP ribazoletransferase [Clostridia bacterium]|nr:adenosylcobinamide-GDP ribazoletransferase [Clostridia bacterium]